MPVRRSLPIWAFAVLLLMAATVGHLLLDSSPAQLPAIPELRFMGGEAPGIGECPPILPTRLNGAVWTREGELLLASNDVVRFRVCSRGTLAIVARGSELGGVGAYLVVSDSLRNLWEGEVTAPVERELDVPEAGWIAVAFLNDRYEPPEDRNLWLQSLEFHPRESGTEPEEPSSTRSSAQAETLATLD